VALEPAFSELYDRVCDLQCALGDLSVSASEDKPLGDSPLLADQLSDAAEELRGWLEEVSLAAYGACQALVHPADHEAARRALAVCQENFNTFVRRFITELAHYERLAELVRLGQRQRGEWKAWAGIVRGNVERCHEPLHAVTLALFRCWQEVAEAAGRTTVSVQTKNIGQQVVMPEGVTGGAGRVGVP
jgi:hypothetical protein